jgi:hypothetical protein
MVVWLPHIFHIQSLYVQNDGDDEAGWLFFSAETLLFFGSNHAGKLVHAIMVSINRSI